MKPCLIVFCGLLSVASMTPAQTIRDSVNQENVDLAESYATDLIATFADLPERWAARQRREIVNSFELANGKYSVERIEEVWASDQKGDVVYTRFSFGDRSGNQNGLDDQPNVFDRDVLSRRTKQQILLKLPGEAWGGVAKIPNTGSTSSHPFNWALGSINASRLGRMVDTGYFHQLLFGTKLGRKFNCIDASWNKSRQLVSYWGFEDDGPISYSLRVTFTKAGFPFSYEILKHKNNSKTDVAKGAVELLQQTQIEWKKFQEVQRNGKPISLPYRIQIQSVMSPNEELECINDIEWKFGKKDVPDSVFVDPMKGEIVEPKFD